MTEARNPAAPGSRWQEAKIAKIERRTPRVTSFFFTLAQPFAFRAGQHVDVRLTAPDGYSAQRSYSIASAPEETGAIELAIEKLDRGEVSPFFHEVAQTGDDVEMRGPIGGHFVWTKEDGGPILLAGAGSGVAPLMSMIRHRAASGSDAPMLLVLSARTWEDVIFRDELLALHDRKNGFQLVLTLTREKPKRTNDYGRRIDAPLFAEVLTRLPQPPKRSYICGSNAFVSAASDALIAAGTEAGTIRTERYGV